MTTLTQVNIPPESLIFAFKFMENAPYRYFDDEKLEYSKPGYIVPVINILYPTEEKDSLRAEGYTIFLDGHIEILVLDTHLCNISEAQIVLRNVALRMN